VGGLIDYYTGSTSLLDLSLSVHAQAREASGFAIANARVVFLFKISSSYYDFTFSFRSLPHRSPKLAEVWDRDRVRPSASGWRRQGKSIVSVCF